MLTSGVRRIFSRDVFYKMDAGRDAASALKESLSGVGGGGGGGRGNLFFFLEKFESVSHEIAVSSYMTSLTSKRAKKYIYTLRLR